MAFHIIFHKVNPDIFFSDERIKCLAFNPGLESEPGLWLDFSEADRLCSSYCHKEWILHSYWMPLPEVA